MKAEADQVEVHGWGGSNTIQFEIQPGQPKSGDILFASLSRTVPRECDLRTNARSTPYGRQDSESASIEILCDYGLSPKTTIIWQTDKMVDVVDQGEDKRIGVSEYLGKNETGYFYIAPYERVKETWPNIISDIQKEFNLDDQMQAESK